jgi:hypothetical protein
MRRINFGPADASDVILKAHGAAAQGAWYLSGNAGGVFPMDFSRSITITNPELGLRGPRNEHNHL